MVDRTIVLNLERRPDRRAKFLAQVAAQDSPWPSSQASPAATSRCAPSPPAGGTRVSLVDFRVTLTIGRDTTDRDELHAQAARLEKYFAHGPRGGAGSEPLRDLAPDILINPAGALIVIVEVDVDDAIMAVMLAGGRIVSAFMGAGLSRATSVMSVQAEPAL